jgi:hypothetical protein
MDAVEDKARGLGRKANRLVGRAYTLWLDINIWIGVAGLALILLVIVVGIVMGLLYKPPAWSLPGSSGK